MIKLSDIVKEKNTSTVKIGLRDWGSVLKTMKAVYQQQQTDGANKSSSPRKEKRKKKRGQIQRRTGRGQKEARVESIATIMSGGDKAWKCPLHQRTSCIYTHRLLLVWWCLLLRFAIQQNIQTALCWVLSLLRRSRLSWDGVMGTSD